MSRWINGSKLTTNATFGLRLMNTHMKMMAKIAVSGKSKSA